MNDVCMKCHQKCSGYYSQNQYQSRRLSTVSCNPEFNFLVLHFEIQFEFAMKARLFDTPHISATNNIAPAKKVKLLKVFANSSCTALNRFGCKQNLEMSD